MATRGLSNRALKLAWTTASRSLTRALIECKDAVALVGHTNAVVLAASVGLSFKFSGVGAFARCLASLLGYAALCYPQEATCLLSWLFSANAALLGVVLAFSAGTWIDMPTTIGLLGVWALKQLTADAPGALLDTLTAVECRPARRERAPSHPHGSTRLSTKLGGRVVQFSFKPATPTSSDD